MCFASPKPKLTIKSGLPTGTRSANSSPRNPKQPEHNMSEMFSFGSNQSISKPIYTSVLKNLEDLGSSLDAVIKRFKNYDKDLYQLILNCEKILKLTKKKIMDMSIEDDPLKHSESSNIKEITTIIKPDLNEYCKFLENLIAYEQAKTEIIIKKTKFPKVRMKEVDKDLTEEFMLKSPSMVKFAKSNDISYVDKSKKEISLLISKIKKNIENNCKIPDDLYKDLEKNTAETSIVIEKNLEIKTSVENMSLVRDYKKILNEKTTVEELLDDLTKEHKKLSGKYLYLIKKLNKQDCKIDFQAKILKGISNDTFSIKQQFNQFIEEMKFYMILLMENISKKAPGVLAILLAPGSTLPLSLPNPEIFIARKSCETIIPINDGLKFAIKTINPNYETQEKIFQKKKIESYKKKISELENKLKDSLEVIKKYEEQYEESENSLDLRSNVDDMIEIQKLKDQIRFISFKANESLETHQKELDFIKVHLSKIKTEKHNLEENIKSLNQKILEFELEKKGFLEEIEKLKSFSPTKDFLLLPRHSADSSPPELTSRSENMSRVDSNENLTLINEEIDEIADMIKQHKIINDHQIGGMGIIRKIIEFLGILQEEVNDEKEDFLTLLTKLVKNYKNKGQYYEKKMHNNSDLLLKNKQLEITKSKLKTKKAELYLKKQQIAYLKKCVKELQVEITKSSQFDQECLKGMFTNIIKDTPRLSADTENMILAFMKILSFSQSEINKIVYERKVKKYPRIFKGLFS
ncbi:hypothetical protein SteCoe_23127 [Stentor coeruleus]|uniref:GRIP domain-containing protein n=1 Tax=Stentor coeruleus TaxID=5963 RepID=A0A1R2BKK8_9CILI|nr:hypothetical protein SteCoe_23127 [Stentor coeruleus]